MWARRASPGDRREGVASACVPGIGLDPCVAHRQQPQKHAWQGVCGMAGGDDV